MKCSFGPCENRKNEAIVRERLQNLFDSAFFKNDSGLMREQYKALRNIQFDCGFDFQPRAVDIGALAENITLACDVLLSPLDVNFIYCGNDTSCVQGNSRLLSKALLNLLSNAYLYGAGRLVTVKTVETADFIRLEVQSGGTFLYGNERGKGLTFVRCVSQRLGGKFFVESDAVSVRAVTVLPKWRGEAEKKEEAYFSEYINDRLSPVYVEFFGMEYH